MIFIKETSVLVEAYASILALESGNLDLVVALSEAWLLVFRVFSWVFLPCSGFSQK